MADRIAVMNDGRVEQIDGPIDLYQRPATTFVADFIGSSNSFTGIRVDGGVDVPGIGVLPGHRVGEESEGHAVLVVRPEDVHLVEAGAALLKGTVLDTQFYGGRSTIAVQVAGHDAPVTASIQGSARAQRGEAISLSWSSERGVILSPPDAP